MGFTHACLINVALRSSSVLSKLFKEKNTYDVIVFAKERMFGPTPEDLEINFDALYIFFTAIPHVVPGLHVIGAILVMADDNLNGQLLQHFQLDMQMAAIKIQTTYPKHTCAPF